MADPIVEAFNRFGDEFQNSPRHEIQALHTMFKKWANDAADASDATAALIDAAEAGNKEAEGNIPFLGQNPRIIFGSRHSAR